MRLYVLVLAGVAGCASPASRPLSEWQLEIPDQPPKKITLPAHLDSELPDSPSEYTLTTTVALDPEQTGQPLALVVEQLGAIARLQVNGGSLAGADEVGWDSYRASGPQRWLIGSELTRGGTLSLALTVEHRWTRSAWIDAPPRLVPGAGDTRYAFIGTFNRTTALAAATVLLVLTALYAFLLIADRPRRAWYAFMSIEAFFGSYYPLWQLGPSQVLMGRWDVAGIILFLQLSMIASVYYLHLRLLERPPSRWFAAASAAAILWALVVRSPFLAVRWGAPLVIVQVMVNLAYHSIVIARAVRRGQKIPVPIKMSWVGWLLVAVLGTNDFLSWLGFGFYTPPVYFASLAIGLFALLVSVAVAVEYLETLSELVNLNEELRRQINDRSRSLSQALAAMASGGEARQLQPGEQIAARYKVLGSLGAGGMASVYEVERLADGAHLALKIIRGQADPHALARFAREAEMISAIKHPNVIGVLDIDVTAGGDLFLVMELVSGTSLEMVRSRFGDVAWAAPLVSQLADALAAVHAHGVIHRDLKPSNILLSGATLKLADFGVATLRRPVRPHGPEDLQATVRDVPVKPESANITQAGMMVGTPRYMAPELSEGAEHATERSDVFGFGLVAYEMLTGKRPFSMSVVMIDRKTGNLPPAPPPLEELCPSLPSEAAWVLGQCLRMDPVGRPSAASVVAALARAKISSPS